MPAKPFLPREVILIVLAAIATRIGVRLESGAGDFWTQGYTFYGEIARNIAAGHGFALDTGPTAARVPLYPMFLAGVMVVRESFYSIVVAQALVGGATVVCAALLARELFGARAAPIAAAFTAFYPYFVIHDTAIQETSLFTLLTVMGIWRLVAARRASSIVQLMVAGVCIALAVLTRATGIVFAVCVPVWVVLLWRESLPRRLAAAAAVVAVIGVTLTPWLIRSYRLTGQAGLGTETGFQLWAGNNPYTFSHYPAESIDASHAAGLDALTADEEATLSGLESNEPAWDAWFMRRALTFMTANPGHTLKAGFQKLGAAFGVIPSPRRSFWPTLVYALSYGPMLLLGITGMIMARRQWREQTIVYLLFASFALTTFVFFGHTSHRAFLDVYLLIFAAGVVSNRLCRSV